MKIAYLMTYAFLGLVMLSLLMVTMVKAVRHGALDQSQKGEMKHTAKDPSSPDEVLKPQERS